MKKILAIIIGSILLFSPILVNSTNTNNTINVGENVTGLYIATDNLQNDKDIERYSLKGEGPIFIIKFSSPEPIYIENITAKYDDKNITGTMHDYFSLMYFCRPPILFRNDVSSMGRSFFNYTHFKFGDLINYTDGLPYTYDGGGWGSSTTGPLLLYSGITYLIYVHGYFYEPDNYSAIKWNTTINVEQDNQLEISSYCSDKLYAIWYGEYDANIVFHRPQIKLMVNGKKQFTIYDNCIYDFLYSDIVDGHDGESSNGSFKVKMNTPNGLVEYLRFVKDDILFEKGYTDSLYGLSGPGEYSFTVNYLNGQSSFEKHWNTMGEYFIVMDIPFL